MPELGASTQAGSLHILTTRPVRYGRLLTVELAECTVADILTLACETTEGS